MQLTKLEVRTCWRQLLEMWPIPYVFCIRGLEWTARTIIAYLFRIVFNGPLGLFIPTYITWIIKLLDVKVIHCAYWKFFSPSFLPFSLLLCLISSFIFLNIFQSLLSPSLSTLSPLLLASSWHLIFLWQRLPPQPSSCLHNVHMCTHFIFYVIFLLYLFYV